MAAALSKAASALRRTSLHVAHTEDRHLAGVPTALSVVDPFAVLPRPDAD
jgi:hypothetical protein